MCGVVQLPTLCCVQGCAMNWIVELGSVWLRNVAGSAGLLLFRETSASLGIAHLGNQQPHKEGGKRKFLQHMAQV